MMKWIEEGKVEKLNLKEGMRDGLD